MTESQNPTVESEPSAGSTEQPPAPQGNTCPTCNGAVAEDQRYCLQCGARLPQTPMWIPPRTAGEAAQEAAPQAALAPGAPRDITPIATVAALVALAIVLVVGVLIGRSGQNNSKTTPAPAVITVPAASTPTPVPTTPSVPTPTSTPIIPDWPPGRTGWTVQLETISKTGATTASISAAKSAAISKAVPSVGVLDGASFIALGSDYVLYSGIDTTSAEASKALKSIKKSYPAAKVIHVVPVGVRTTTPSFPSSGGAHRGLASAAHTVKR